MKLDADEPNWSVTLDVTCTQPSTTLAVAGTLSGSE
jgi:hypothetical protein